MSAFDPGCVKTPTLNLRVESPSRFRRCGKPIALATSVRRRQLRKQFCASLAQASFHTAWTRSGHPQQLAQECDSWSAAIKLRQHRTSPGSSLANSYTTAVSEIARTVCAGDRTQPFRTDPEFE